MKKILVFMLALILMLSTILTPASAELAPMTTDQITITFATWDREDEYADVINRCVARFEAAYPNINVEVIDISSDDIFDILLNTAAAGTMPDLYLTYQVPILVQNGWALDVTEYLDNDPDAAEIMQSYREVGQVLERDYAIPAYTHPYVSIVNTTMIKNYNLEIPDADWTWDEYVELAENLAHYEDYNFGTGGHAPYRWYLALMEGRSSFGWDGNQYNFDDAWVDSLLLEADWASNHVWEGFDSEEEKIQALGSASVWIPGAGVIGLFTDYSWGAKQFITFLNKKTGQDFVIYPQPLGETGNAMAVVDYCAISPTAEYPRETYELSKWLMWGVPACEERLAWYGETGGKLITRCPVITNQAIWDAYAEHHGENVKLFDSVRDYIPEAALVAPNHAAVESWINDNNILFGIRDGSIDGYAILDELNEMANSLVQEYYDNLILE